MNELMNCGGTPRVSLCWRYLHLKLFVALEHCSSWIWDYRMSERVINLPSVRSSSYHWRDYMQATRKVCWIMHCLHLKWFFSRWALILLLRSWTRGRPRMTFCTSRTSRRVVTSTRPSGRSGRATPSIGWTCSKLCDDPPPLSTSQRT